MNERGEFAVLSRTPAAAAASVAVDVHAKHAVKHAAKYAVKHAAKYAEGHSLEKRLIEVREDARPDADRVRSRGKKRAGKASSTPPPPAGRSDDPKQPVVRVSTLTDQELLEGLRAQSEPHFAELYDRYFQRIYNFVYARIRNHVDCEEIVQETFIAVFRSFGNYRAQSSLLSWIYGIAKNTTNNSLRRARTQNERIDLVEESELGPASSLGVHSPDQLLDLHRFGDELSERLEQVADWQAEIFAMRHLENLSIPEISKRTNRSSDAVRSSLYRVKRIFFEAAHPGGTYVIPAEDNS